MLPATNVVAPQKPKRRWFQYSLRSLLIFMTVSGFGLGWLGVKVQKAKRQHEAVETIVKGGGEIAYDYQFGPEDEWIQNATPSGPTWLQSMLGLDLFHDVVKVRVHTDFQMERLVDFPRLRSLAMRCQNNAVTNAGLEHLRDVPQLRSLMIGTCPHITDAGLVHLRDLTQLRQLKISLLEITDAGLEHIKGLHQLEELNLGGQITDAGLEQLRGLTQLKTLNILLTGVTDEGVQKLQQALPGCNFVRDQ